MSKLDNLIELKERLHLKVTQDYKQNERAIYVANHSCLLDGLYVPASLNKDVVSLVSSRLIYKVDNRQKNVEKYLNAFPIEAHGGKVYSDMCLKYVLKILENNIDVNIFPQGAYIQDNSIVTKGRVGAAKLLFDIRDRGIYYDIVPVAINIKNKIEDLDSFDINDNEVEVSILKPIYYEDYYYDYKNAKPDEVRNIYHKIIDIAMKNIANVINKKYVDEYIPLYPKGNVMYENGQKIDTITAQRHEYILQYENELNRRTKRLIFELKK